VEQLAAPDGERRLILKRWVDGDADERRGWVEREAEVLTALERAGLLAPRLVASSPGPRPTGSPLWS